MEVSEREYAQLRIEHISYQHGLSVIIRLLENDAKVKDVIIIARGILKLYHHSLTTELLQIIHVGMRYVQFLIVHIHVPKLPLSIMQQLMYKLYQKLLK